MGFKCQRSRPNPNPDPEFPGFILKNSGFGIDFEKFGIWDVLWKIRDLGLGFGMEFGKFGIWDSVFEIRDLGANHFGIGIPNADL